MTYNKMIEDFKKEFKALLAKYNANICFEVGAGSDTYGIYDEKMVVCFKTPEPKRPYKITCFDLCQGWEITKNNL